MRVFARPANSDRWFTISRTILLWGPLALLAACYLWLAIDRGTLRLWRTIVHESGRYTLQETVFYYGHFVRELPVDVAYALFLACAAAPLALGRRLPVSSARRIRAGVGLAFAAALSLGIGAFWVAAGRDGLDSVLADLLQYRTRDDLLAYGSHWHYHWLSTIWFGCAAAVAAAVVNVWSSARNTSPARHVSLLRLLPWVYFVALTLIFGLSADVFVHVRYAGHQAREILTHGLITLPIWFGILAFIVDPVVRRAQHESTSPPEPVSWKDRRVPLLLSFLIPVYLLVMALSGDVLSEGQSDLGVAAMVAGHFFEHVLDYVFVLLFAIAVFGTILISAANWNDDCCSSDRV